MSKLTKNQKSVADKVEAGKMYTLKEAAELVKEITTTKFDASLDIDVRLGVDPRKANQMVRGVVSLPNGTGKVTRVLALCTPDQEAAAKEAGADYVGLDEYVEKIKGGWTDIDVIITMPSCMGKIGPLGRVLGPRGLMPNPKSGTVTMDVAKAVKEVKQGKIDFKVDKAGIIHTSIGKVSMTSEQIYGNAKEFINTVIKLKPAAAKGTYIKSIFISSTMSKGINIMGFCKEFNARTQDKAGKILPVVITYYTDKSFSFVIKTPPAAVQLKEAAKVKSGSAQPNRKKVASVTWEQVKAIAEDKMNDLNCFTVESAMRLIAGTARSMGITVKGDFPE